MGKNLKLLICHDMLLSLGPTGLAIRAKPGSPIGWQNVHTSASNQRYWTLGVETVPCYLTWYSKNLQTVECCMFL